jgi:bifunctional DNA-binding transcriptional regulator/antitoxin component of YhaV-PrlF toxin-antitoxin module
MDQHVSMAANGRLVIPAKLRAALGMEDGGAFVARLEDGSIRLQPLREVIAHVQAEVRRYVPAGTRLSDELIEDRRREAQGE